MLTLPSNLLGLSDPVVGPLNHLLSSRKKMTRKRIKPTMLPMTMPTIASVLRAMISQIVIQLLLERCEVLNCRSVEREHHRE